MTARPPLVHVIEDDAAVADSLAALLESWSFDARVWPSAEAFLDDAAPREADCIVLDLRLPGRDGLSLLRDLRGDGVQSPVIVVTASGNVELAVQALKAGATDFVEKPYDALDLVERIRTAVTERSERAARTGFLDRLTPRETEVMREVVAGFANKQIAHRLGLSIKTVEAHRAKVMEKTGARTVSHLVRLAIDAGVDPAEPAD